MTFRNAYILILVTGWIFFIIPARLQAGQEKYLWIEMEDAERLRDGSLNLKLNLYFGMFPDKKGPVDEIQDLEAFYIKKGFGKSISAECYKADINKSDSSYYINIISPDENSYTLYVNGIKTKGSDKYKYYAKTTFALFGKSSIDDNIDLSADTKSINRQLEINTVPEFHYWPQTGTPLKISTAFNGSPLVNNHLHIHDEHNPEINVISDHSGEILYVAPEDDELNRKGSTAFKHAIVTVEHSEAGVKYISSRTLILHRSRYGNYRLYTGVTIFGLVTAVFFMSMYFVRKRTAF